MFTISQGGAELDRLLKMQSEDMEKIAARAKHIDAQKQLILGVLASGMPRLGNKNAVQLILEDKPNKLWSIPALMTATGLSKDSVQRQLFQLTNNGLAIKIEKGKVLGYVSGLFGTLSQLMHGHLIDVETKKG